MTISCLNLEFLFCPHPEVKVWDLTNRKEYAIIRYCIETERVIGAVK